MILVLALHFMHKKLQNSFSLKKFAYRFSAFILRRKQKKLKENKYDMVNSFRGQTLALPQVRYNNSLYVLSTRHGSCSSFHYSPV